MVIRRSRPFKRNQPTACIAIICFLLYALLGDVKRKAGVHKHTGRRSEAKACGLSRTPYRLASLMRGNLSGNILRE